ncbi:MAG: cytochrome c biogenesis protein CcsA [Planctomycetes bacterium]|nr:cytochrome c biogenesis protein CcsA [Planctomycetota bacterium]
MSMAEIVLFWIMVLLYAAAFCVNIITFVIRRRGIARSARRLLYAGLLFHTTTLVVRWVAGGHVPVTDAYELAIVGAWFTILVFLAFERLGKAHPAIGLIVTPIVFLVLGNGFVARTDAIPMGPAYQSPWLLVHVAFAWLAFGPFAVATGSAVLLLVKDRWPAWQPMANVPNLEALDDNAHRFIILGFINHVIMLVSGAIWAKKLWGHYWNWDALEIWSLITFLFYAFYLHARAFLGWKMTRAAWLAVFGLVILVISFWVVDWFAPSPHPGP